MSMLVSLIFIDDQSLVSSGGSYKDWRAGNRGKGNMSPIWPEYGAFLYNFYYTEG